MHSNDFKVLLLALSCWSVTCNILMTGWVILSCHDDSLFV